MSTDYGVYCLDCKEANIFDENRSPKHAVEVIAMAPRLAVLREGLGNLDVEVKVGYGIRVDLGWFEVHGTHKLDVIDEYGGFWPCCTYGDGHGKYQVEGEKYNRYCKRKDNHKGEKCSDKSVFAWANRE